MAFNTTKRTGNAPQKKESNRAKRSRLIRWAWAVVYIPVAMLAIVLTLTAIGAFGKLPTFEELENQLLKHGETTSLETIYESLLPSTKRKTDRKELLK